MRTRVADSLPRWTPRSTSHRGCCSACRRRSSRRRVRHPPMNSAGTRPLAASEIAALTGGRLVGPGTVTVAGIAPLERAGPGDLSFLASPRYAPYFERTSASVVLVAPALEGTNGGPETRIVVPDPYAALLVVLPVLYPQAVWEAGVHPTAVIGRGATWQEPIAIGPHAVIGHEVQLGRNVRIGAACVLGDGVAVGDDTELYPGVTLYAGTAGSCQVEDDVIIGGQSGISDHLTIGRGARLLVQSGHIANVPAKATLFGTPARAHREFLRAQATMYRLAKILDELEALVQSKPEVPEVPEAPPHETPPVDTER